MSWTLLPFIFIAVWSTLNVIGGERRRLLDEAETAKRPAEPEKATAVGSRK